MQKPTSGFEGRIRTRASHVPTKHHSDHYTMRSVSNQSTFSTTVAYTKRRGPPCMAAVVGQHYYSQALAPTMNNY